MAARRPVPLVTKWKEALGASAQDGSTWSFQASRGWRLSAAFNATWRPFWGSSHPEDLTADGTSSPRSPKRPRCHGTVGIKAGQLQVSDMLQRLVLLDALHLLRVMKHPILRGNNQKAAIGTGEREGNPGDHSIPPRSPRKMREYHRIPRRTWCMRL